MGTELIMFCTKCGNELIDGDLFCGKCGTRINADATQEPEGAPVREAGRAQEVKSVGDEKGRKSRMPLKPQTAGAGLNRRMPHQKARVRHKGPVKLTDEQKMQIGSLYANSVAKNANVGFGRLFSFAGRASRSEFWLIQICLGMLLGFFWGVLWFGFGFTSDTGFMVMFLASCAFFVPVYVRRLHDLDVSGGMLVIKIGANILCMAFGSLGDILLLVIEIGWLIALGFVRGTVGKNQYGESPLGEESMVELEVAKRVNNMVSGIRMQNAAKRLKQHSVTERFARLNELKAAGMISDEEFEKKRQLILDEV